jgi:hypothetical protein
MLKGRFFEQHFDDVIADFSIAHTLCGNDSDTIDDACGRRNVRCHLQNELFGGDVFRLSGEDKIAVVKGHRDRKAMHVDASLFL